MGNGVMEGAAPPEVEVGFMIVIKLYKDGSLNVTGPITDKILSLGMLELAKDVVQRSVINKNMVQVPKFILPRRDPQGEVK